MSRETAERFRPHWPDGVTRNGWWSAAPRQPAHPGLDTTRDSPASTLHEPLEARRGDRQHAFQLGASIATYGIGRALGRSCVARVGADLIQAQLLAEGLTFAFKEATRRETRGNRILIPVGSHDGHVRVGDVLQRHFGWKVGLPAYAVASYVAVSRVEMKEHYLSDVMFGAALGTVAGRTVAVSRSQQLAISPVVSADRAEIVFSLQRRVTGS